ncbi:MAG: methyltransferase domain-containing protein [Actinobacteria bacterium]|nr:methyltransferase domain-containing protein [Actinomycetota bacterium]
MPGWPFWAATGDDRIDRALELANLSAGERFIDLGCGDGRVLLRAARQRQAVVSGVELDADLAATARALLEDNGVPATIIEADFADAPLEADVVFAYLSPATLQRLSPRLSRLAPGTRVVTAGYAVPGWVATSADDGCYLYRLPMEMQEVDRGRRGWATPGLLISIRPDSATLVAAKLHHAGGPVDLHLTGALAGVAAVRAGADEAEAGAEVVADLRFEPLAEGTFVDGSVELGPGPGPERPPERGDGPERPPERGDGPERPPERAVRGGAQARLQVFAVVDSGEAGVWGLSESGCDDVAAAAAGGRLERVLATARRLGSAPTPRWPLWAATSDERIDLALDLAGLRPGERLLDVGCGDGRVLLRAAVLRQATVHGIEIDPELAAKARELLADHGIAATITEADFTQASLDADVVFAYLSTATLQRLTPRLAQLPAGARVVTAEHPVPGWQADAFAGGCWLYHLPALPVLVDRARRGWASAGLLISIRPESRLLTVAKLHHPGGPVTVTVGEELAGVVSVRAGADLAPAGEEVAVDLQFEPLAEGALVTGMVFGPEGATLRIFAAVDAGQPGLWGLTEGDCVKVAGVFSDGDPSPALEAARAFASAG